MQQIERRCKNTNEMLILELQKLAKECDYLMTVYAARQLVIAKALKKSQTDQEQEKLREHQDATASKLGVISAFERIVGGQIKSLQMLKEKPAFSRTAYIEQFKVAHEKTTGWASKILSSEAPRDIKHHYHPFTKIIKTIANIVLPFTVVVPLVKMAVQGRNHFFFTRKTNVENFAGDVLFRMRRYAPPAQKADNKAKAVEKSNVGGALTL